MVEIKRNSEYTVPYAGTGLKRPSLLLLIPLMVVLVSCSLNLEQLLMFHLYHSHNDEILEATHDTDIDPAYLASLISLESDPPGNNGSERFEPAVYKRLLDLKYEGRPFGGLSFDTIRRRTDPELRRLATSYGLTQIMGYHCINLGCKIADLKGKNQLNWAVRYMVIHYGIHAKRKEWDACFRIHNTGHPRGKPARKDYVQKGLSRMMKYRELMRREGSLF